MTDKVTQADRDASAELARELKLRSCSERGDMIAGRDDDDHLIQAFARHRLNTNAELVEALREAQEALREYACHGGDGVPCLRSPDQCRTECGKAAGDAFVRIDKALSLYAKDGDER